MSSSTSFLNRLRNRWHVKSTLQVILILCTFAIGGSLSGYLGRQLLLLTGLERGPLWYLLYIPAVTLLWPLCVLIISIPMGQLAFFRSYLVKMGRRMTGRR